MVQAGVPSLTRAGAAPVAVEVAGELLVEVAVVAVAGVAVPARHHRAAAGVLLTSLPHHLDGAVAAPLPGRLGDPPRRGKAEADGAARQVARRSWARKATSSSHLSKCSPVRAATAKKFITRTCVCTKISRQNHPKSCVSKISLANPPRMRHHRVVVEEADGVLQEAPVAGVQLADLEEAVVVVGVVHPVAHQVCPHSILSFNTLFYTYIPYLILAKPRHIASHASVSVQIHT